MPLSQNSDRAPSIRRAGLVSALLGACSLVWFAQAANGQGAPYRLGPGDRVSFTVAEAPEFSTAFAEVGSDGSISLGENRGGVRVTGLTLTQAAREIENRLERWLRAATVTLTLDQPRGSSVRLMGALRPVGAKPIGPGATLFELLSGIEVLESNSGILQFRRAAANGLVEQLELPLSALMSGLDPRYMLPLRDGDLISVPPGQPITVYFVDEVQTTVQFSADEPRTLLRAVAKAGGLSERSSNKLIITRTLNDGSLTTIEARYKRILDGKDPDIVLLQGDLIRVKRSII